RKRLLAWVRRRSEQLEGCRDSRKDIYRLSVTLILDPETKVVDRVGLNTTRAEIPPKVTACLRAKMMDWVPPAQFVSKRERLVFGLTI
ncbi:MAG: hypothetical protein AAGI01_17705, partial [Myxococcota bacterium]